MALTTHPPYSAEVKERVELHLYSHLWGLVACYRVNCKDSLPANNEICQHYRNEKLAQILKRRNENWEIRVKRKLIVIQRREIFIFIFWRSVDFLFFGQKKPSTLYFPDTRSRRLYIFPTPEAVDFIFSPHQKPSILYFPAVSQFRIENCNFCFLLAVVLPASSWLITE